MSSGNLPSEHATVAPSTADRVALIVEDTADLRVLFARELADAGFTVVEASDGPAAIEQAHRFAPQAILLDLMLPGINGFNVARLLRDDERTRGAAIVAVTALASERLRISALEAGCDLFIRKPVAAADVVDQLIRLLEQRRAPPSAPPANH
jgi:chemosensory pili system protein ChpA (sensor histidine kinase/response regulator)